MAPSECRNDFYNRKCHYSIVLQAVADYQYRFTDINIKWPGRVHDARVLSNSSLYSIGQNGKLFPNWSETIEGREIPIMIIADVAYPLSWLMRGFKDNGKLTKDQVQFTHRLSRARMVIEVAFGRLKGRFRCLLKRCDTSLANLPTKVASCCVLHNICELRGDLCQESWINNDVTAADTVDVCCDNESESCALEIREALTAYFSNN